MDSINIIRETGDRESASAEHTTFAKAGESKGPGKLKGEDFRHRGKRFNGQMDFRDAVATRPL